MDPENYRVLVSYARICATMGNTEEAKTVINALPPEQQESPEVTALIAQMEFDEIAGDGESDEALLQKLEANPDDHDSRYQLAAKQMMTGQTEEALENLLTIMKKDRQFNDDAARKMIFKIFDSLGDHPLVAKYRRKMMSLIY